MSAPRCRCKPACKPLHNVKKAVEVIDLVEEMGLSCALALRFVGLSRKQWNLLLERSRASCRPRHRAYWDRWVEVAGSPCDLCPGKVAPSDRDTYAITEVYMGVRITLHFCSPQCRASWEADDNKEKGL